MRGAVVTLAALFLGGTLATAGLAMVDTGFSCYVKLASGAAFEGGVDQVSWESPGADAYIGAIDSEDGYGWASFMGDFTMTNSGPMRGNWTGYQSLGLPFSKLNKKETKLSLKGKQGADHPFASDLSHLLQGVHAITETPPVLKKKKKNKVMLGGEVEIESSKTSGFIKVDTKTYTKYKGNATVRWTGTIKDGPNAGKKAKGTLKIKLSGSRDI